MEGPHVVFIPFPDQGHITPLLKLAQILHSRGFYITYISTEYNHNRLLKSGCLNSLKDLDDFRFEAIPDGLPPADHQGTQDTTALCVSTKTNFLVPFRDLLLKINNSPDVPKVTCIIADGIMSFTLKVAEELGVLELLFWTSSACGFMGYLQFAELIKRGYTPFKDESCLTNGYLDTPLDWIPGMKGIHLRDLPSFIRTTNRDDIFLNFDLEEAQTAQKAWGVILNTFNELEDEAILALKSMFPRLYTIGSLSTFVNQLPLIPSKLIGSSLWKEDAQCLKWLDEQEAASVVYVNFGSLTVMTSQQLIEFAWGLANSKHKFLWIIRPDLVEGEKAILPEKFGLETKGRGIIASWCSQEEVLSHPSVGVFLTHSGWNSTLESIGGGV